jgi:hypothetical protein
MSLVIVAHTRHALGVIAMMYLAVQSTWSLAAGFHPRHSPLGIVWTAITATAMFSLATGKARTGRALNNPRPPDAEILGYGGARRHERVSRKQPMWQVGQNGLGVEMTAASAARRSGTAR